MREHLVLASVAATALALAGCGSSTPLTEPTVEEQARERYAALTDSATHLQLGDVLGYDGAGELLGRAPSNCVEATCSVGFLLRAAPSTSFSVDDVELEVTAGRPGGWRVIERSSGERSDVHVLGYWMEHVFFASEVSHVRNEEDPEFGNSFVAFYAFGVSTGENPAILEGSASWRGAVVARDSGVAGNTESVIEGDASIIASFAGNADMSAAVEFTNLADISDPSRTHGDMQWMELAVTQGSFSRHGDVGDVIDGRFYGPEQQEVGGIFERDGLAGAFGGRREP